MKTVQITLHPTVVQVHVGGRTLGELFSASANALATTLAGESGRSSSNHRTSIDFEETISVRGVDSTSLLVEWLTALIGMADMESVVPDLIEIDAIDETSLTSRVGGYHVHEFVQPVNSVNYESVKIKSEPNGFNAEFTLEL